ncbi:MAG: hypothetical protein A3C15_03210 [Candidatus Magasanikbacteria bacterium RIFCSPHIGHO2_02_FULL_50_9b]|uniref:RNA polymerase sigma factor 70 region 4 type 2 domain-containing protein n=1 Tax=Candidatus Magasanikbacteria bacterium RIFCSPHIGHO2_02_FULL_50_9b TaxID=1798682 RepID=A0A1F6M7E9_9BACT|nr:MAG: hypothetical protein A3C15_03210 [Candidatus Magasanikbacteria bacterium RIFCSPHIGHO2_02_FULL_50_9b]
MPHSSDQQFIRWYDDYADAIFRHCYYRVFDRERARELMQETYTRAWEYVRSGKNVENARALLYRIANNLVIDEARKRSSNPTYATSSLEELHEHGFDPVSRHDHLHELVTTDEVRRILEGLNDDERSLILMRYVDGFGPQDIARILSETPNVISVRLHRCVQKCARLKSAVPTPPKTSETPAL